MKRILVLSVVCLFVLGMTTLAFASQWPPEVVAKVKVFKDLATDKKDMPPSHEGVKNITTAELKKWMDEKKKFILLDNRVKDQYDAEKIKGAEWLLADHLLADPKLADKYKKDDIIVLYCNGVKCWRSPAAAVMLQHLGFKNLYWYRDGIPVWKDAKYPTE